jgi:hypothetical protein
LEKKEILRCSSVKEACIGETGLWTYPQTDKENSSLCALFYKTQQENETKFYDSMKHGVH